MHTVEQFSIGYQILIFATTLNQLPVASIAASLPLQFLSPTTKQSKIAVENCGLAANDLRVVVTCVDSLAKSDKP